jgi:hypothetical protein
MKVIFLDIDGVLNCHSSRSRCGIYIGIDDDKVKRLRKIVDATGAKIVLSSSWRIDWWKDEYNNTECGRYIDRKLKRERLAILDKTGTDLHDRRRLEIERWMQGKDIEAYVILDDLDYDWGYSDCVNHWVETSFDKDGLQDEHVEKAIEILNASNKVQATN